MQWANRTLQWPQWQELRLAQESLASITGAFTADDLLGEIFARHNLIDQTALQRRLRRERLAREGSGNQLPHLDDPQSRERLRRKFCHRLATRLFS